MPASHARLASPQISGFYAAAQAVRTSVLSIDDSLEDYDCRFQGNAKGAFVWDGGIILLGFGIPNTLGVVVNDKSGGLIARGDGTLL